MRRFYTVLLSVVTVAGVATLGLVVWAERAMTPMVSQTSTSLAWLYRFDVWGPWLAWLLLALGAVSIVALWRNRDAPWLRRSYFGMAGCLLVFIATVWATHVRRVEVMLFTPLPRVEHVPIGEAEHVADDMPVMGLELGGEARAYPLNLMAFHHIANDVVADQPIVATY